MSKKIYMIVVCYNWEVENIEFLNYQIVKERYIPIIFDNSDKSYFQSKNSVYCLQSQIKYMTEHKNVGLSKAYNSVLKTIRKNENNWVVTLDQDTFFSEEYFKNLLHSIENKDTLIKTGIVYFGDQIGSPVKMLKEQYGVVRNAEVINSGLMLRSDLFESVSYDERLFLDLVDYKLLYDLREKGYRNIELIKGTIRQDFSGLDYSSKEKVKSRYSIYAKDFSEYCRITNKSAIYRQYILGKRKLNIIVKLFLRGNLF